MDSNPNGHDQSISIGPDQQALDGPATAAATPLVPSKEVEAPVRVKNRPGSIGLQQQVYKTNFETTINTQAAIAVGEPNHAAPVVQEPQADAAASTMTTATPAQPAATTPTLLKNSGTIHDLEVSDGLIRHGVRPI